MNIQYHFNVLHYQIMLQGEGGTEYFNMMYSVNTLINCSIFMLHFMIDGVGNKMQKIVHAAIHNTQDHPSVTLCTCNR